MIVFLIFVAIAFVLALVAVRLIDLDADAGVGLFITIWAVLSLFSFVGVVAIDSTLETTMQKTNSVEIYSIGNSVGTEGRFVLGGGYIESEMYYFYYVQGEYGYKIDKIKAKDIEIEERDDEEQIAYIITYKARLEQENWFVAFGKDIVGAPQTTIISVPKGTIKVSYNISL